MDIHYICFHCFKFFFWLIEKAMFMLLYNEDNVYLMVWTHVKLCFGLGQAGVIYAVHQEDDAVDGGEVVLPHASSCSEQHSALMSGGSDSHRRSVIYSPWAWPPRSKVVKVMPAIVSSSEAERRNRHKHHFLWLKSPQLHENRFRFQTVQGWTGLIAWMKSSVWITKRMRSLKYYFSICAICELVSLHDEMKWNASKYSMKEICIHDHHSRPTQRFFIAVTCNCAALFSHSRIHKTVKSQWIETLCSVGVGVVSVHSLGCKVGTCWPSLSSLSMCSSVVLPALSRPRNTNFPDFLYSPETDLIQFNRSVFTLFYSRKPHTSPALKLTLDSALPVMWRLQTYSEIVVSRYLQLFRTVNSITEECSAWTHDQTNTVIETSFTMSCSDWLSQTKVSYTPHQTNILQENSGY